MPDHTPGRNSHSHGSEATAPPPGRATPAPGLREHELQILRWLRVFVGPGQVTECRGLNVRGGYSSYAVSGFYDYDHHPELAKAAWGYGGPSGSAAGVYFTPNPLSPDLLARRCNKMDRAGKGDAAGDAEVAARRWLLIDVDPQRLSGISSTDAEKAVARGVADALRAHLAAQGWPAPVLADSGNGFHLLYRIDLPADDGGLVGRCLRALAARFDAPGAKVDQAVFNPSRIWKLYGTWSRKGAGTAARPHRPSAVLEVPGCADPTRPDAPRLVVTPRDLIEALAAEAPPARPHAPAAARHAPQARPGQFNHRLLVAAWLKDRGVAGREVADGDGVKWQIDCPFNAAHKSPDAFIKQFHDGAVCAKCSHNSCQGQDWASFKERIGRPERHHYDPPLSDGRGDGARGGGARQAGGEAPPGPGRDAEEAPPPEGPPWPGPLAEEALHGLAGDLVRVIEPASEADPVALLLQFLVGFGSIIGRSAHWVAEADRHFGNEFAVLVGRTAKARKGGSWGQVRRVLELADPDWARDCIAAGLSSGEGLVWNVRDAITKRENVARKGEEARFQEVEVDGGVADKRLLVQEGEFASVLKAVERQGNNLSMNLRLAWDGLDLRSMVKNNPARATGPHISVIGHITGEELRRCLSSTEIANGLGNRHILACVKRSKLLPDGGSLDVEALGRVADGVRHAVAFARGVGLVVRDDGARAIWHEVYGPLSEGRPGLAGAMLARGEAHVMRLAMLYALLDRSSVVAAGHLKAALAVWDYAVQSVLHVFGDSLGDEVADELLRLLRSRPDGASRTEMRDHFNKHQPADRIEKALALLAGTGLAFKVSKQTRGRPEERWHASPRPPGT